MPPKRYFEQVEAAVQASTIAQSEKNATLFISRLPYTATSTDLETLFSDVGPLKRAFVVTDPNTKLSKGVGYVTFAIVEDSKAALEQLQGKSLDGKRKMQITFADEKAPMKERKAQRAAANAALEEGAEAAPVAKKPRTSVPAAPRAQFSSEKDADAVRTVILSGLAGCTPKADSKQIYKRARKIGDVENVIYPHNNSDDVAHVVFRTPNHAMTAVEKLHAHTFKGVQISAVLKKRADNAAKLAAHMRPETLKKREQMRSEIEKNSGKGSMPVISAEVDKTSRLILRNLPFDITEADLRAIFLPHGPIYSIDIPTTQVDAKVAKAADEKAKKAAANSDDAESSDEEESEDVEMKEDEEEKEKEKEKDEEEKEDDDEDEEEEEDGSESESDSDDDDDDEEAKEEEADDKESTEPAQAVTRGRGFAFVWHVSRADAVRALAAVNGRAIRHGAAEHAVYKAAKGQKGRAVAKVALDAVRATAQPERIVAVDWALSKKEWEAKAEQSEAESSAAEDDEDDDEEAEDEEEEEKEKPALPQPEEGTTLFIRNLPYQATEEELKNVFRNFGPLRYAKITMDRAMNRSKGTGFVCFWQAASAEAALEQARVIEREAGVGSLTAASAAKNPFALPSVLTADPSAPLTASLTLHGRVLNVIPAVTRGDASKLETSGRKDREKTDKRNTWLMREGVPFPETDLNKALSPAECEKRLQSYTLRKSQLGGNPSLFISKTRLAIRQLPLFVTDKVLKKLALHAIRSFKDEVKEGKRPDLDEDEKADKTISAVLESSAPKRKERQTAVVQAKIVRQPDRIDPLTGQGRSRGYGFLEMRSFGEALRVLRWANANKEVQNLFFGWWKEDLTQSIAALKKQVAAKLKYIETAPKGTFNEAENKEEAENMEARVKRMQRKLDELEQQGKVEKSERGGLLALEFSVENVTITKKRSERATAVRDGVARRERSDDGPSNDRRGRDDRRGRPSDDSHQDRRGKHHANWNKKSSEKNKPSERDAKKATGTVEKEKSKSKFGSLIGRKRKMKKA